MDKNIFSFSVAYIEEKLVYCKGPGAYGKALQVNLYNMWRYVVGDYRILAMIEDDIVVITVVEVGHSREIFR